MRALGGRGTRVLLAALALAAVALGPAPVATAGPSLPHTYVGPAYSTALAAPPTQTENQSKLWFAADAWWALLLEPTGKTVRVFELMPDHTWRPTSAVIDADTGEVGDALVDGDTVHVVNRHSDGALYYVRLHLDPSTRDYRADPPQLVTARGGTTPAAIVKDTQGRLWIGFASGINVLVTYSDDGLVWSRGLVLARTGGLTPEQAALVSFDDRVGVLWSDQVSGSFQFASHRDGDDPEFWVREPAQQGDGEADNHISLMAVPGEPLDTLVAAVKTSRGDIGDDPQAPLIELLVRGPDARWSTVPIGTVGDGMNDPIVQVDMTTRTVFVLASANGNIVAKRSSLDAPGFPSGLGDLFVLGPDRGVIDPTGSKRPVDARSGLVVLASDTVSETYRHAELPITPPTPVADPADTTPPGAPQQVQGRAVSPESAVLSWNAAHDGDRWVPGGDGVPVAGYVVSRNGVEVATVTSTSFEDRVRGTAAASAATTVEYQVQAVDAAGNRSAVVTVSVGLPATSSSRASDLVARGLLVLAAIVGCYALRRLWVSQRMTRRDRPPAGPAATPEGEAEKLPVEPSALPR